jgi:hypothetical protein
MRTTSVLFSTSMIGLPAKSGLIEWKSLHCASMLYPHCSLGSMKYRMQLFKCAIAVMLCISIVFISSSGWSRIPGARRQRLPSRPPSGAHRACR